MDLKPGFVSSTADSLVRLIVRPVTKVLFRPTLEGVEQLPDQGAYLLVANHSAGIAIAELTSFAGLWRTRVKRPLSGFAHHMGFRIEPLKSIHKHIGTVPSTYEGADAAIEAGVPLLVFPGGDYESLRPVWQAHRVNYNGRQGYLRIAQKHRLPIVPMGIRGSHFTAPILWRSKLLANLLITPRLIGTKRWGLSLLGLVVTVALMLLPIPLWARAVLAYLWLGSPLIFLPIFPARIRFRIGTPLEPFAKPGADIDAAATEVLESIQALVTKS